MCVFALAMQLAGASPAPTTIPKSNTGEHYFVSSGHRYYVDWKRPTNVAVRYVSGVIEGYQVLGEGATDIPRALVTFTADAPHTYSGPVVLAQPISINGVPYSCLNEAASSASEFVHRFAVCSTLPGAVLNHRVRISLYEMKFPGDGGSTFVTDSIQGL